jgi:hypothetical protein
LVADLRKSIRRAKPYEERPIHGVDRQFPPIDAGWASSILVGHAGTAIKPTTRRHQPDRVENKPSAACVMASP